MRRTKAYIAIGAVIALIAIFSVLSLALASPEVRHPYPVKGYVTMGGKPVSAGVEVIITDNTCGGSLTATTDNTGFYYREIYQAIPASQNGDSFTCSVSYAGETGSCSFNLDLSKSSQQCDIYLVDTISPQAVAKPEYQTVYVNQAAQFNGSNSTDNVGIVRYHWDFGDGTNKTGETVSNSYSLADTYPVTLTVYDAAGNSDSDTCEVSVIPSPTEHNVTFNVTEPTNTIDGYNVTINETGRITVIGDGNLTETVIIDMGNGTRLEFDIDVDDDLKNGTIKGIEYDTPEVPVGDESLNRSVDIDLNLNSSKDWTGDQNISLTLQPLNDLRDTATWTESAGANATNATTIVMSGFGLSGIGTAIVMHAELSGINETDVESLPISMTVDGAWYRDVAGSKSANVYLFKFYDNGTKKDQKNPTSVHHDATNDTYTFHFEMDGFSVFALVAGVVAPTAAGGPTSGEPFDKT
ncbi:hypothetical protein B6U67_05960 [Methanosarcinales archaeon ex4484_138]|nr:MAG: hypothetical protein B6U67_05960 [Methanosarcinales archaeon ex4484_138]